MIRILALLAMLSDHMVQVYFPNIEEFNIVGRFAFPLFAWWIAKGFKRTSNYKLYCLRLLILAVISQIPFFLLFKSAHLNVCFTLVTGLIVLKVYESELSYLLKCIIIIGFLALSHIMNFEYGIYGVATIVIFYLFDNGKYCILLQLAATIVGIAIYRYYPVQIFSVLVCPIVMYLYKYDTKINRIVQYTFYPLHMMLLWMFSFVLK